eukprot:238323-Prymnesium_polylepis.1
MHLGHRRRYERGGSDESSSDEGIDPSFSSSAVDPSFTFTEPQALEKGRLADTRRIIEGEAGNGDEVVHCCNGESMTPHVNESSTD